MNPIVKNPHFYFNSFLDTKIILKIQPLALPPAPITERKIICFCCPILRRSQLMKEERIKFFFFFVNWALCWPPHWMHRISIPTCVGHHFWSRLMAEGGHEWWKLFVSFFCSFWPPRGVGVQNPLLAIKSIYLLFCLHPLYLLFLFE